MIMDLKDKTVEQWLDEVSYAPDPDYVPSEFALEMVNFIKLVNGAEGEENKTPVLHYKILDTVASSNRVVNMIHRGAAKTTLMEYLFLYLGVYGKMPNFGRIELALYVSDSIDNGVKNMRKNLEFRYENSEFLKKYIKEIRFTDIRWEFTNIEGLKTVIKGYGAKALSLDSVLFTKNGTTTIGDCKVGDWIYDPTGRLVQITKKSEVFYKPMYKITLEDGRSIKVSEDHINSVVVKENVHNTARYVNKDLTTKELLELPLLFSRNRVDKQGRPYVSNERLVFVENTRPLEYPTKDLPIDPYTLGLLLGDGSFKKDGSNVLTGHINDMEVYKQYIPYELGKPYIDTRNANVLSYSIKGISQKVRNLGLIVHGSKKFIPTEYFYASIEQRVALLQGLMDTDGHIQENGRCGFCSSSEKLVDDVASLVRSLGGTVKKHKVKNAWRIEIWGEYICFKLPRKSKRFKHRTKPLMAIQSIESIPIEPSQCIAVDSDLHQFLTGDYVRTHNTGVRGTKEQGKRPRLAVLDDLVSDEDARSPTVISTIEDTVYKAVDYALHPTNSKIIWSGTPFNANDPLYKAVESGAWAVNVFPVCEKFPCSKEEFRGSWEDRFTYEYVKSKYEKAVKAGKADTFNQELMLRIMSDEERLILDDDIQWFNRENVMRNRSAFNFYITTDFATSEKQSADYSFISVWAINNKGMWYWVDGICKRQTMDKNVDALFKLVQQYNPINVGIEITGQQLGFVSWIQNEMINRNIFFMLASQNNDGRAGIRPTTDKLQRFNTAVPMFKQKMMFFPSEFRDRHEALDELIGELRLATVGGFKSKHDDAIDTVSMLNSLNAWKPSEEMVSGHYDNHGLWKEDTATDSSSGLGSYIV